MTTHHITGQEILDAKRDCLALVRAYVTGDDTGYSAIMEPRLATARAALPLIYCQTELLVTNLLVIFGDDPERLDTHLRHLLALGPDDDL